ncbi:MAG: hypothetical protein SPI15_08020 [Candidatus Faecousia sp.]|nr:hypothetical protein [Clostridiales bacterium]MDY6180788.1 hypothetical protein [Candidatus Faecousia sp.]
MKKCVAILMAMVLALGLLAGCSGEPVSTPSTTEAPSVTETPASTEVPASAAAVKTGLYVGASVSESKSATAEGNGQAKYDVTLVAVTVSDEGVIESCVIDSIPGTVKFDASGIITSDTSADVPTKNELGDSYGMKAYAGSRYEWNEQVAALAAYAVGKTVEELKDGAVDETGHAADADLASTATIYLGGYVSAIEAAVNNAQHLGASSGDRLVLASLNSVGSSKNAEGDKAGTAQLDADVTAVTMNDGVITSCYIDSLQAKVNFDAAGTITTDLSAPILTKNEMGEGYGLKAYAGSKYEWNEQAAAFAAYVTGKTAQEVAGIAVNEKTAPADADLAATVTISIAGFQALIAKAAAQ